MIDPLREEAKTAVAECHQAGIRVVMVTGDHPSTALAIARELGVAQEKGEVILRVRVNRIGSDATSGTCKKD